MTFLFAGKRPTRRGGRKNPNGELKSVELKERRLSHVFLNKCFCVDDLWAKVCANTLENICGKTKFKSNTNIAGKTKNRSTGPLQNAQIVKTTKVLLVFLFRFRVSCRIKHTCIKSRTTPSCVKVGITATTPNCLKVGIIVLKAAVDIISLSARVFESLSVLFFQQNEIFKTHNQVYLLMLYFRMKSLRIPI